MFAPLRPIRNGVYGELRGVVVNENVEVEVFGERASRIK